MKIRNQIVLIKSFMKHCFYPLFVFFFFNMSFLFGKDMVGAGSSFCYPLYKKMFSVYGKKNKKRINYQSIGSGGGERQLQNKIVSFCASESPSLKENLFVFIPSCAAPVVLSYNLPNNPQICLTPKILARIYLGKIKKWNHPDLLKINPKTPLPNMDIIVVHRSDSSGTSFIFSKFLSQVSPLWKKNVGWGLSLQWPKGLGANKNMGIASYIKQIPGSIGYLLYSYAMLNQLPSASIQNSQKKFVHPSIFFQKKGPSLSEAFENYPLITITWLITYKDQSALHSTIKKSQDLIALFWWMIHKTHSYAQELFYIPLSPQLIKKGETAIFSINHKKKKIFSFTPQETSK